MHRSGLAQSRPSVLPAPPGYQSRIFGLPSILPGNPIPISQQSIPCTFHGQPNCPPPPRQLTPQSANITLALGHEREAEGQRKSVQRLTSSDHCPTKAPPPHGCRHRLCNNPLARRAPKSTVLHALSKADARRPPSDIPVIGHAALIPTSKFHRQPANKLSNTSSKRCVPL